MARRGPLVALLLLTGAIGCTNALAAGPVRISASFGRNARLGSSTVLNLGLHVDTRRLRSPVTAVRISYPRGLGLVSSSLGLAACDRPESEFQQVLISGHGLGGCPPNAVMAYGSAQATVRLVENDQVIPEYAALSVLSGPIDHDHLKLVIFIDGQHPFGARLILAGAAVSARAPYGGALVVHFPQVAAIRDLAVINLTDLQIAIGSPRIRYHDHGSTYHPEGIALPDRCPHRGLRFALDLRFQDRTRRSTTTAVRCPPPSLAH